MIHNNEAPDLDFDGGAGFHIRVEDDHCTFLSDVRFLFHEPIGKLVRILFSRAVVVAQKGYLNSALADGLMAMQLAVYAPEVENVAIYGFMTQLLIDMERFGEARRMLDRAWEQHEEEKDDETSNALAELEEQLGGESWKSSFICN